MTPRNIISLFALSLTINQTFALDSLTDCINDVIHQEAEWYIEENKAFCDISSNKILICSDNIPLDYIPDENIIIVNRYFIESIPSEFIDWFKDQGCYAITISYNLIGNNLTIDARYDFGNNIAIIPYLPEGGGINTYTYRFNCETNTWENY